MKTGIFIPTYNAIRDYQYFNSTLKTLSLLDNDHFRVLVIDSSSIDGTIALVNNYKFEVQIINKQDFDHGRTRQLAAEILSDCDVLVYLTQDVELSGVESIYNTIKVFDSINVGASFGRQLPHKNADIFAVESRRFNYPTESYVRCYKDRLKYGVKTVFSSDSFAAYRREALVKVGGFPSKCIVSEDMYVVAKMVKTGYSIAYAADAICYHSHNYTIKQEFHRYFDIGVFFATEHWIKYEFGAAEKEGGRSVIKLVKAVLISKPWMAFSLITRVFVRWLAYKLGANYKKLPNGIIHMLSAQRQYWK